MPICLSISRHAPDDVTPFGVPQFAHHSTQGALAKLATLGFDIPPHSGLRRTLIPYHFHGIGSRVQFGSVFIVVDFGPDDRVDEFDAERHDGGVDFRDRGEGALRLTTPLRKHNADGNPYFRPVSIDESLAELTQLSIEQVARRAHITDVDDSEYVPSECVLHFVRKSKFFGDGDACRELFLVLRQRVLRAVPVRLRKVADGSGLGIKASESEIQEFVLHAFQEMLCADRMEYDERLDFYEIRFNAAIAALRATARRTVARYETRRETLACDSDTLTPSLEIEHSLARLNDSGGHKEIDFRYRSRLFEAISSLHPDERRVIELILQGIPIDSNDENVITIVKVLGSVEKTVRNRRDRAFATIRKALTEKEDE